MKQFTVLNPTRNVLIFCGESGTGKNFLANHVLGLTYEDVNKFEKEKVEAIKVLSLQGNLVIIITNNESVAAEYYQAFSQEVSK